jgi:tetratricopeptide (TPR) repeat protein
MSALDELLARWRENPDSGTTLALCAFLGSSRREDLIREVGATAEAWHREDGQVMLALGRMYLDAGFLQEAQAALVTAGKLSPSTGSPYRFLGEVLLRRGDAQRAEKVLARALQIGQSDADTRMWHDRAVVYVALQQRVGLRAVADEIERTVPKRNSIPPPTVASTFGAANATSTRRVATAAAPRIAPVPASKVALPRSPKLVPKTPAGPPTLGSGRAEAISEGDIPTGQFSRNETIDITRDELESFSLAEEELPGPSAYTAATVKRRVQPQPKLRSVPPPAFEPPTVSASLGLTSPRAPAARARTPLPGPFAPSMPPPPSSGRGGRGGRGGRADRGDRAAPSSLPPPPIPPAPALRSSLPPPPFAMPAPQSSLPPPPVPSFAPRSPLPPPAPVPSFAPRSPLPPVPSFAPPAPSFAPRAPSPRPVAGRHDGVRADGFDDSPSPAAETVLEHLARVGVYERNGGAQPAWASPTRERPRGTWVFAAAIVFASAAGFGAFTYARKVRVERMASARSLETEVARLLETGNVKDVQSTDDKLSHVFELDSRSERAALLWLQNRVLSALLLPGETRGIESALSRCKTLSIDESKTIFGKVASFLAEGDIAGAAAILPKWDDKLKNDPMYQLVAGAMLERAGDGRAANRYKEAARLDPNLVLAKVFHAELLTLEAGYADGKPLIDIATQALGDNPMARALSGLLWVVSGADGEVPESARVAPAEREKLPTQLLSIPYVIDARVASIAGHADTATAELDKALRVTATPAMAAWIAQVAIELGDEKLARAATLRALSYSAVYPKARSLAARVALLGGHIDEAKSAIQDLDAKTPEVAVVRAAAAYEGMDPSELESAASQIGSPDGPARALSAGLGLMLGKKVPAAAAIEQMATPSVPWGDLVAVDAALDAGNLPLAGKITAGWGERASTPAYALRLARLSRYSGKLADALEQSETALVAGGVTSRVLIERFQSLLAKTDIASLRALVGQYPAVLGPMTEYLKVTIDVADGKAPRAKAAAARLEPPPGETPVLFDLIAAQALIAVDDRRGKVILEGLFRKVPKHPDVVELVKSLTGR